LTLVRLRAIFFDVGETLVNEEGYWHAVAGLAGLEPHVVCAALGVSIARGEDHSALWRHLGVPRPDAVSELVYDVNDLYPDAVPCLHAMRDLGLFVGIVGNQSTAMERWAREQGLPADLIASSAGWRVSKPARGFFERIVREANAAPEQVAYVGDRVDFDVIPAAEAGLLAVHIRRGPWGWLQSGSERATIRIDTLAELPEAIGA
jgi:FMN phosphatase YigB (HAD superfamily)